MVKIRIKTSSSGRSSGGRSSSSRSSSSRSSGGRSSSSRSSSGRSSGGRTSSTINSSDRRSASRDSDNRSSGGRSSSSRSSSDRSTSRSSNDNRNSSSWSNRSKSKSSKNNSSNKNNTSWRYKDNERNHNNVDDDFSNDYQDNNYHIDEDQRDYSYEEPSSRSRNVFISYKQDNRSTHPNEEVSYNQPQQSGPIYKVGSTPKRKRTYKALKIIIPIAIVLFVIGLISNAFEEYDKITKSTVHRQALAEGLVDKTGYLSDETDWIENKSDTLDGLREFYTKTGIQPYLYVTESINEYEKPTSEELDVFTSALYDELFTDEAHMLFVFCYHAQSYSAWHACGNEASTVIDEEAVDILFDYIDHYYYENRLQYNFGNVFAKTGGRIMTVTKPPFAMAIIVIIVALALGLLYWWWQRNRKKKAKEEQLMEDILDTPLEKFGDLEVEELADKYEDTDESL